MAIHGDRRAIEAVASLGEPTLPLEIIVVNTGTGSLREMLGATLDRVVLVESPNRRLPGGTRNLGLAEARAPIIAFLAADCLAAPGWVACRIAAHETAEAVASAILPAPDDNGRISVAALASHMLTYSRRDPALPAGRAVRYGASYRRDLLARHGTFLEDRLVGEDTEFNTRLAEPPAWAPDVVTLHRNSTRMGTALAEAWERGGRLQRWMQGRGSYPTARSLRWAAGAALDALLLLKDVPARRRGSLMAATPLVWCLALARIGGALWQAARSPRVTTD